MSIGYTCWISVWSEPPGITKTGMGKMAERLNVGNKFAAILGGSEEIMADLSMKLAMGAFPTNARL